MFYPSQVPQRAQDQVGPDEDVQCLRRAVAYAVLGVLEVREAVWIGERPPGDRVIVYIHLLKFAAEVAWKWTARRRRG